MIEHLEVNISHIPSGRGLEEGPAMIVVPSLSGATTAELYVRFGHAPASCRSQEPVAAIASTGLLNSPDRVGVTGTRLDNGVFELALEIRAFNGPLAGNDPWIALVQMELGILHPGAYLLIARKTVLGFSDLHHPEYATNPTSTDERMSFDCG